MRWFFLAFILLLAIGGNCAVFEYISWTRLIGGFAFNVFVVALLVVWKFSYFSNGLAKARGLVVGHALFMLAAGVALVCVGGSSALSGSCESFISSSSAQGMRTQFATYVQSLGYCRELGLGVVLLGLFVGYPSIRLFIGITRRSNGPPSASAEL